MSSSSLAKAASSAAADLLRVTCDVEFETIKNTSVLQPGDTIGVDGSATASGIALTYHVGIYIGKDTEGNDQVIDFTNNSDVRRVHLDEFSGGLGVYRINYISAPEAKAPAVIVERAAAAWKDPTEFNPSYDVLFNNCEQFVTYCTFGKRFSLQVKRAALAASALLATSSAVLALKN